METNNTQTPNDIYNKRGVSKGCRILFTSAITCDLSDENDIYYFERHAIPEILLQLDMYGIRATAKFFNIKIASRAKRHAAYELASGWASVVHPTHRPSNNSSIVIVDCPAMHFVKPLR